MEYVGAYLFGFERGGDAHEATVGGLESLGLVQTILPKHQHEIKIIKIELGRSVVGTFVGNLPIGKTFIPLMNCRNLFNI
jgi:hypothetical protein